MATALMSLVTGSPGARRRGDDRRAHADRPGAADRRPQGEGARRSAGGRASGCSRPAATSPTSRTSPSRCARAWTSSGCEEISDVFDAALQNGRPGYARPSSEARNAKDQRGRDGEQESAEGREGRPVRAIQPVCPAARSRTRICARTSCHAFEYARDAYGRLNNGKNPTKQIFEDKKLQKHIRETAGSVRDASVSLYEAPKKKKKRRRARAPAAGRHRRHRRGARAVRGAAQEGARRAVRRRGGVRVHLDHLIANTRRNGRLD